MGQGVPGGQAATAGPRFYCLEQWLRPVAEDPAVQIDEQQRRALTETDAAVGRKGQVGPVLVGEEGIPDADTRATHGLSSSSPKGSRMWKLAHCAGGAH